MDIGYMSDNCLKIAVAVALIFGLKIITGIISALSIGSPLRTAIHAGLGIAQIGEFSFVLAVAGKASRAYHRGFLSNFPFILCGNNDNDALCP